MLKENPAWSGVEEALLGEVFCSIYRQPVRREELPDLTGNIWQWLSFRGIVTVLFRSDYS